MVPAPALEPVVKETNSRTEPTTRGGRGTQKETQIQLGTEETTIGDYLSLTQIVFAVLKQALEVLEGEPLC